MADLALIGTAISSLKTSMDIAKAINNSTTTLSEAETKLKIADLISTLADARTELADVQDLIREKDYKIRSLKEEISKKKSLSFDGKLYWQENDNTPFCSICWEKDEKLVHLKFCAYYPGSNNGMIFFSPKEEHYICRICENEYSLK